MSRCKKISFLSVICAASFLVIAPVFALYNGTPIQKEPLNYFPRFLVLIEAVYASGETSFCTGAALAPDVILTAGHCILEARTVSVKVIDAQSSAKSKTVKLKTFKAKSWKSNPQMNGGFEGSQLAEFSTETAARFHDIGLIILTKASNDVVPVIIAPPSFEPAGSNSWKFVFGWGRDKQYRVNGNLEFAELLSTEKIGGSNVYTSDLKHETGWCKRDSGGPVTVGAENEDGTYQHFLIGVSFAFFDGFQRGDEQELKKIWGDLERVPGCGNRVGFTSINPEAPWIEQTLKELLPNEARPLPYFDRF